MGKKKKKKPARGDKTLEVNKRARHDYEIVQEFEAGLALVGSEVKAMRDGKVSLAEAYCQFKGDELFLYQAHVAEYVQAHARNHPPLRPRKLLLHRRELEQLQRGSSRDGMTIVPLELYVKGRVIKLLIGLARGKKLHDKRQSIKERDEKREMQRAMRRDRG
jgi:SsrA-binding protein